MEEGKDSTTMVMKLEKFADEMAQEIGEELYPKDEESVNGEEIKEKIDCYRTHYIDLEAKEVINLVSSDDDSD